MANVDLKKESPNYDSCALPTISLRDYFASKAMLAVMQETQEMRIGSFGDWIKQILVTYLQFTFLTVKYVKVDNVYEEAAQRAYEYADAMLSIRKDSIACQQGNL
jgi:hypothetical protein